MTPEQQKTLSNEQSIMREQLIEVWGEEKTDKLIFPQVRVCVLFENNWALAHTDVLHFSTPEAALKALQEQWEERIKNYINLVTQQRLDSQLAAGDIELKATLHINSAKTPNEFVERFNDSYISLEEEISLEYTEIYIPLMREVNEHDEHE